MNQRVYLETTIPSYLTARPSRDIVRAAEQEVTRAWWASRDRFGVYVSDLVVKEVTAGDPEAAVQRIQSLAGIPVLELTAEAQRLGTELVKRAALPAKAAIDALHISIAAVHGIDYLLTWNCKHIANATMRSKIELVCRTLRIEPPIICTPMELLEE